MNTTDRITVITVFAVLLSPFFSPSASETCDGDVDEGMVDDNVPVVSDRDETFVKVEVPRYIGDSLVAVVRVYTASLSWVLG